MLGLPFSPLRLLSEPITYLRTLLPYKFSALRPPPHDHFAPHPSVPFEGYYTRILTSQGHTILLIFSSVYNRGARNPHYLHFSLIPTASAATDSTTITQPFMFNTYPTITDKHFRTLSDGVREFSRIAKGPGVKGTYDIRASGQEYKIHFLEQDIDVAVSLTKRTPWGGGGNRNEAEVEVEVATSTPEGALSSLVHLLPLHWNVLSTHSAATYTIAQRGATIAAGTGVAHVEKNWGASFPAGWTWLQGFFAGGGADSEDVRTFAAAGGKILGMRAYLLGYRSPKTGSEFSFGPPWSLMPFGCRRTVFASETIESENGRVVVDVASLARRIRVEAKAPRMHDGWTPLSCPLGDGHDNVFAYESFEGVLDVRVYKRYWWWGAWEVVERTVFERAAVELGGEYSHKVVKDEHLE